MVAEKVEEGNGTEDEGETEDEDETYGNPPRVIKRVRADGLGGEEGGSVIGGGGNAVVKRMAL